MNYDFDSDKKIYIFEFTGIHEISKLFKRLKIDESIFWEAILNNNESLIDLENYNDRGDCEKYGQISFCKSSFFTGDSRSTIEKLTYKATVYLSQKKLEKFINVFTKNNSKVRFAINLMSLSKK